MWSRVMEYEHYHAFPEFHYCHTKNGHQVLDETQFMERDSFDETKKTDIGTERIPDQGKSLHQAWSVIGFQNIEKRDKLFLQYPEVSVRNAVFPVRGRCDIDFRFCLLSLQGQFTLFVKNSKYSRNLYT